MFLEEIANIICKEGLANENRSITIKTYKDSKTLWSGKAKELKEWTTKKKNWVVVEILINENDTRDISDCNKGKIITVV